MIVYLIGDSIRMNSEPHVRALLPGVTVQSPAENCDHSGKVCANVAKWAPATVADIVHLNCGLHDIRYDPGTSSPVCTLGQYELNLTSVFEVVAQNGATVIWATSTPFNEDQHNSVKESRRYNKDLVRYNESSVRIAQSFGFRINDLYTTVSQAGLDNLLLPDGLHFNAAGNALVGAAIANAIRANVPPNSSSKSTPLRGTA